MPSRTFQNLNTAKKQRVQDALLTEFSHHSLPDAEVARIIKHAAISRGAFYKYFTDLTDAYTYLLKEVMEEIHTPIPAKNQHLSGEDYYQLVVDFVDRVQQSPYYEFVRYHFLTNEAVLMVRRSPLNYGDLEWAVMTLCHATINECLQDPTDQAGALKRLETVLHKLTK